MAVTIAVPKESMDGEKRVACVPEVVTRFEKIGVKVVVESGAGLGSCYSDDAYTEAGATVVPDRSSFKDADIVVRVQPPTPAEAGEVGADQILVGFMSPSANHEMIKVLRDNKTTSISVELIPRISRAQAMDALSSQASIAGYKAALMAADHLTKFFPMLTTPTGTIRPAKVLVIGAGVAGLQAIATAKRLGAMVEAYDVRSATKEQVESLGGKFLQVEIKAEAEGGYARELNEDEKAMQQEMLAKHIAAADAVITTAAIPGRPSPRIIFKEMVDNMKSGSVIVDLAAEGGGNCELTKPGESVMHDGVEIYGPLNIPSLVSFHASETYAKNLMNLIQLMVEEGELKPDWEDEILRDGSLTRDGQIMHAPTKEAIEGGAA